MPRFILIVLLFLLSLLAIFPTPSHYIWYVTIMVTEFPWIFLCVTALLLLLSLRAKKFKTWSIILCVISFIFFSYPVAGAYCVGYGLKQKFEVAFGPGSARLTGLHQETPFAFTRMIKGTGAEKVDY